MKTRLFSTSTLCALALCAATTAHAQSVTGAGSSFAAPIYQAWGHSAQGTTGVAVNYQSVGSSAGQNQVIARTVDFGASDKPMAADGLAKNKLFQFPTVMGGIVVVVNVPGVEPGKLRLDGETLAGLFDGDITEWDDDKIKALNPGLKLPDTPVAPVHRADGSGTSFVFTSYLSKMSPEWKQKLGAGTSIAWPGGAGAHGNDGVAATVRDTEGGIGYVEYAYAANNHLNAAQLRNQAGHFVTADLKSFSAAASAADWTHADHYAVDLLDTAGESAWPIVTATFVLVPTNPSDAAQGAAVQKFFAWGLKSGDADATRLDYVPLPASVKADVLAQWPH